MDGKILISGKEVKYRVRRMDSKYLSLRVRENLEIDVGLPRGSRLTPEKILDNKRAWIEKKYRELSSRQRIFDGNKCLFKGTEFDISVVPADDNQSRVYLEEGSRTLTLHTNDEDATALWARWMRARTRKYAEQRSYRLARLIGVKFDRIFIRSMRKWGSCSIRKNLSFNFQLIGLPEELAEYVIIHELAHLADFSHSRNFWSIVASACPDYAERRKSLKRYAPLYPAPGIYQASSRILT